MLYGLCAFGYVTSDHAQKSVYKIVKAVSLRSGYTAEREEGAKLMMRVLLEGGVHTKTRKGEY
jgi:hypothetical protein